MQSPIVLKGIIELNFDGNVELFEKIDESVNKIGGDCAACHNGLNGKMRKERHEVCRDALSIDEEA
jgi:hypothetical protein